MANLVYISTVHNSLPDIDIISGQVIYCQDVPESYYDTAGGIRMQMSNVVYLYNEKDREDLADIDPNTLYVVISVNKFYKWKMRTGWERITTTSDMYDLIDEIEELVPSTIQQHGTKIAPKTLATNVFTSRGERVEDLLGNISKIARSVAYYTIEQDNMSEFEIPFPFDNYIDLGNYLDVFVGSVWIDEKRYHIDGNKMILSDPNDPSFGKGRDIVFKFLYNSSMPATGVISSIDGHYITNASIPTMKMEKVTNDVYVSNPDYLPTTRVTNFLFTTLNEKLNSIAGNLIAHAISAGENGFNLTTTIANFNLVDNSTIYLKLHTAIEDDAVLSVNGGPPIPIYLNYKEAIRKGLSAGDVLSLTYSAMYNKFFVNSSVAYKLERYTQNYVAIGGESEIAIEIAEFEPEFDKLKIYQNNVRLFEEINYRIADRKIFLIAYNCKEGDTFLIEMEKVVGNGLPVDGNTIIKEVNFVEHVVFDKGFTSNGDVNINGNLNIDGEIHFAGGAASSSAFTAQQFISTAEDGMPPMIVKSQTLVENFNADMVDGYHARDLPTIDETVEFIIDGETDVMDPTIQIQFKSFYSRIEALNDRMFTTDAEKIKAPKRNMIDDIPLNMIDPADPLAAEVIRDTVEDIVWRLDDLNYRVLQTIQVGENEIDDINNWSDELIANIPVGNTFLPQLLPFIGNITDMNRRIDELLFDIEERMITVIDKDSQEDPVQVLRTAMADEKYSIDKYEVPSTYEVMTQSRATRAKYLQVHEKRIYPITHRNAVVGLPNDPIATQPQLEDVKMLVQGQDSKLEDMLDNIAVIDKKITDVEAEISGVVGGKTVLLANTPIQFDDYNIPKPS